MTVCSGMFVHIIADRDAECIYIANEIEDEIKASERSKRYYPDILYRHSFKETKLIGHEAAEAFRRAAETHELHNIAIFKAPESAGEEIMQWVESVTELVEANRKELFNAREEAMIAETVKNLRLTRVMAGELESLMKKYKIKLGNIDFLRQYSDIKVATKNEVRVVYGCIKEHVAKSIFPHLR